MPAASPCTYAPTKPRHGKKYSWEDTRNNPARGREAHPLHSGASSAPPPGVPHTRVHTYAHGAGVGKQSRPGRARPDLRLCHRRVCLLACPPRLSSPAASEEWVEPGVWARVKSCTIFYRLCVCAQYKPLRLRVRAHGCTQWALLKEVHLYIYMHSHTEIDNTCTFASHRS